MLAGGQGTRLRALVPDLPKPMAPVAGRPFLERLLQQLGQGGVTRVILSVGYMAERIVSHFGSTFHGMTIDYVREATPLGTGGATRLAMQAGSADHQFIFNGDTFLALDIAAVEQRWQRHRQALIVARHVDDVSRYGSLLTDGKRITRFLEKGDSGPGLINAGCYVLARSALDTFAAGTPFALETDYLAPLVLQQPCDVYVCDGRFIDIGVADDYRRAQALFGA